MAMTFRTSGLGEDTKDQQDNSDDAWGLVKLGLYGNGRGDFGGQTEKFVDKFTEIYGEGAGNAETALTHARLGNPEAIKWIRENLPESMQEDFEWYPGGLLQEDRDWVGAIKTKPGMLRSDENMLWCSFSMA